MSFLSTLLGWKLCLLSYLDFEVKRLWSKREESAEALCGPPCHWILSLLVASSFNKRG